MYNKFINSLHSFQRSKFVSNVCPRVVYTSGRAIRTTGLTVNVLRDEERGEFVIEAEALLVVDNGVCSAV